MKQNKENVSAMNNEKRNLWSRKQLTNALVKLLKKKELQKISVSELCEEAGVGRVTYYRNYSDMEEIVLDYLLEINKEWTVDAVKDEIPFNEKFRLIFKHFENHRKFYEVLNERGLVYLLKDVVTSAWNLERLLDGSPVEAYSGAYIIYMVYGFIEVWFKRGMKDSSDDMALLLSGVGK